MEIIVLESTVVESASSATSPYVGFAPWLFSNSSVEFNVCIPLHQAQQGYVIVGAIFTRQ
jgi:hypothetical protein